MKCANHPPVDSVAFCGQCGKALCAECKREVSGTVYCESCLAARLHSPTLPSIFSPTGGPNPGVALGLGFIPGVGAIYNGQVMKAIVQVLLFGSLIAIANRVSDPFDAIFGLGAAAFYFYMVIDSYQTARAMQLGQPAPEWFGLGDFKMSGTLSAGLLIALGGLFLLDNFGIPVFREFSKFWPLLLIALGVLILQRRTVGARGRIPGVKQDEVPEGKGSGPHAPNEKTGGTT